MTRYDVIFLVFKIKLVESLDRHATVLEKPKLTGLFVQHIVGCIGLSYPIRLTLASKILI